jgi:hypothetical protein
MLYRMMMVPELRTRYLGYVRDVAENWLTWDRIGPIADDYQALIHDAVVADRRKLYSTGEFESGAQASLRPFIESRQSFLLDWLDTNAGAAQL